MVTGLARSALQANGRFRFPSPFLVAGQMTLATAREQSLQFAKYLTNNVLLRGAVEGERGRWVDPHLLTLCADAYFVHSQLRPFDVDTFPEDGRRDLQRVFGPQWLLPLCNARQLPEMTVQVAVDGNDVSFRGNAPVSPYYSLTTAFMGRGVPDALSDALPVSAERAVRYAFDRLGVRIAEVPALYARGHAFANGGLYSLRTRIGPARQCNRWKVVLESEVMLRGLTSNVMQRTREVWVSNATCEMLDLAPVLQIALPVQPTDSYIEAWDAGVRRFVNVDFAAPVYLEACERVPTP
jgi:hypothetical protein